MAILGIRVAVQARPRFYEFERDDADQRFFDTHRQPDGSGRRAEMGHPIVVPVGVAEDGSSGDSRMEGSPFLGKARQVFGRDEGDISTAMLAAGVRCVCAVVVFVRWHGG